jgi:hypothetical protein
MLDLDYIRYDDNDLRCKLDMPMYKYVGFEGENIGRKFMGCECKVG